MLYRVASIVVILGVVLALSCHQTSAACYKPWTKQGEFKEAKKASLAAVLVNLNEHDTKGNLTLQCGTGRVTTKEPGTAVACVRKLVSDKDHIQWHGSSGNYTAGDLPIATPCALPFSTPANATLANHVRIVGDQNITISFTVASGSGALRVNCNGKNIDIQAGQTGNCTTKAPSTTFGNEKAGTKSFGTFTINSHGNHTEEWN